PGTRDRLSAEDARDVDVVNVPVYYHNYMMVEWLASQVHHAIAREVAHGADPAAVVYVDDKGVGVFMKKRVFEPGRSLPWNELTRQATGEGLNARAFAGDFTGQQERVPGRFEVEGRTGAT